MREKLLTVPLKRPLDTIVEKLFKKVGDMCFVAGGYARAAVERDAPFASDVDIYMYDVRYHSVVHDWLSENAEAVHGNETPDTFRDAEGVELQLIKPRIKTYTYDSGTALPFVDTIFNYGTVFNVISDFDFSVCQAALEWDPERNRVVGIVTRRFLEDHETKTIRVTAYPSPAKIFNRFVRYAQKGYNVPQFEIYKALENYNQLDPESRAHAMAQYPYDYY